MSTSEREKLIDQAKMALDADLQSTPEERFARLVKSGLINTGGDVIGMRADDSERDSEPDTAAVESKVQTGVRKASRGRVRRTG